MAEDTNQATTLPPCSAAEYESFIPITPLGLMLKIEEDKESRSVLVVGYRKAFDGSQGPAEKQRLIRNLGDAIVAVNGISTTGKSLNETAALLKQECHHSGRNSVCIRFRRMDSNKEAGTSENILGSSSTMMPAFSPDQEGLTIRGANKTLPGIETAQTPEKPPHNNNGPIVKQANNETTVTDTTIVKKIHQPKLGTQKDMNQAATLQPCSAEEYESFIPITPLGLMLKIEAGPDHRSVLVVGYRKAFDGSQGPAEKQRLIRNLGDAIAAVNGISTAGKSLNETAALLKQECHHSGRNSVCIRFRCMDNKGAGTLSENILGSSSTKTSEFSPVPEGLTIRGANKTLPGVETAQMPENPPHNDNSPIAKQANDEAPVPDTTIAKKFHQPQMAIQPIVQQATATDEVQVTEGHQPAILQPPTTWPAYYAPPATSSWPHYYQAVSKKYSKNVECVEVFFTNIIQEGFDEAQMVEALTSNDDLVLLIVTPPDNQVALAHQFKFDKKTVTRPQGTNKLWSLFGMDQNALAVNIQFRELARKPDSPVLSPDPSKFWECRNKDEFIALSASGPYKWEQNNCCVLPPLMAACLANMSVADPALAALEVMKAAKSCDALLYASGRERDPTNAPKPHADHCIGLLNLLWHAAQSNPDPDCTTNVYPLVGRASIWANNRRDLCIGGRAHHRVGMNNSAVQAVGNKRNIAESFEQDSAPKNMQSLKRSRFPSKKKLPISEESILYEIWKRHQDGIVNVNYTRMTNECGHHEQTESWLVAFLNLRRKGLVAQASYDGRIQIGYYKLTESGINAIETDEQKKSMEGSADSRTETTAHSQETPFQDETNRQVSTIEGVAENTDVIKEAAGIPPIMSKILFELCQRSGFKNNGVGKKMLAAAVGFQHVESKGFRGPLKSLKDCGDVDIFQDRVSITAKGRRKVPGGDQLFEKKMTNVEQHAFIARTVFVPNYKPGCGKMVETLGDGSFQTKLSVANKMGCARVDSSGFRECCKALHDNGMIESHRSGDETMIRLTDDAFPEGRPCDQAVRPNGRSPNAGISDLIHVAGDQQRLHTALPRDRVRQKINKNTQIKILSYMGKHSMRTDITKKEVATHLGTVPGSHGFFYAWQDLEKNQGMLSKITGHYYCLTEKGKKCILG